MHIVVTLDDDYYGFLQKCKEDGEGLFVAETLIIGGKILPKGHGRIVDFDELCEAYWDGNSMTINEYDEKNIRILLEADKGDDNENDKRP